MTLDNASAPDAIRLELRGLTDSAAKALNSGQFDIAKQQLARALQLAPAEAGLWLQLAAVHRAQKDYTAAMSALDEALRVEPRNFLALLMRASMIDASGMYKQAALAYGKALSVVPPQQMLDGPTRRALQRAQELNREHVHGLRKHLHHVVVDGCGMGSPQEESRLRQFLDTTVGLLPRYRQEPTEFFYPGLPAIEFWPRADFSWLAELEKQTPRIQHELAGVLGDAAGFTPYVDYDGTIPLDQWATLNRSLDWSAFHLFHQGRRHPENCARCPETLAALARVDQPQAPGRMPAAMFSVLRPGVRIPPHTGVANVRLVVHLPLIVPPGCGFRVGSETREWKVGEAWVFDDTIEHEAWNNSDQLRVILIFDVWNPLLSEWEREAIARGMAAMDEFNEVEPTTISL